MSFYRYPSDNQIKLWQTQGKSLRWSIKVHRGITHFHRFNTLALERFESFRSIFGPMDKMIDFYLFQLPKSISPTSKPKIEEFFHRSKLKHRFALEWRASDWFLR